MKPRLEVNDLKGWTADLLLARRSVCLAGIAYSEGRIPADELLNVDHVLIEDMAGRGIDELWFDDKVHFDDKDDLSLRSAFQEHLRDVEEALGTVIGHPELQALRLGLQDVPVTDADRAAIAEGYRADCEARTGSHPQWQQAIHRVLDEHGFRSHEHQVVAGPPLGLRAHLNQPPRRSP